MTKNHGPIAPGLPDGRRAGVAGSANVEIKARVHDVSALERAAASLSGGPPTVLRQEDTFFPVAHGRLKLRRFGDRHGELILYDRPDDPGPKRSDYSIVPTNEPDALASMLTNALGSAGVVCKERRLYLVGQTRVHVDRVEGLGDFVELEVVLRSGQTTEEGRAIADDLMRRLDIRPDELVAGAYLDLLRAMPPLTIGEVPRS